LKAITEQNNNECLYLASVASGKGLGGVLFELKNDGEDMEEDG
jgi:hypothetical protein